MAIEIFGIQEAFVAGGALVRSLGSVEMDFLMAATHGQSEFARSAITVRLTCVHKRDQRPSHIPQRRTGSRRFVRPAVFEKACGASYQDDRQVCKYP